jgi:hypothetical protein
MKIVEMCHIYWQDFIDNKVNINLKKEYHLFKNIEENDTVFPVILIDDTGIKATQEQRKEFIHQLQSWFDTEQIEVNNFAFYFESDCCQYAQSVIDRLPPEKLKKESFQRGKSSTTFLMKDDLKIPLFKETQEDKIYTCPLLSAVWVLIKNQVISHFDFKGLLEEQITILPIIYKETEEKVQYILKMANIELKQKQSYSFY